MNKLSYVLGISINQNHHADMLSSIEVKNNHKKKNNNNNIKRVYINKCITV